MGHKPSRRIRLRKIKREKEQVKLLGAKEWEVVVIGALMQPSEDNFIV